MDSGATHHLTNDLGNLNLHSEYSGPEEVQLGNGSTLPICHVGSSSIPNTSLCLRNVLHVPKSNSNLLSVGALTKSNDVSVEFFNKFLL